MTTQTAGATVRSSVEVGAAIDRAFRIFTTEIGTWWGPGHHLLKGEPVEMPLEPFVGGNVYDRGVDGSECRWARVLVYEPPDRLVISWDITRRWNLETDQARTSEVEVRFTERGPDHTLVERGPDHTLVELEPDHTLVELEHRHLERHGDGWEQSRDAVASPGGWPAGMRAFAELSQTGHSTNPNRAESDKEFPCTQS